MYYEMIIAIRLTPSIVIYLLFLVVKTFTILGNFEYIIWYY